MNESTGMSVADVAALSGGGFGGFGGGFEGLIYLAVIASMFGGGFGFGGLGGNGAALMGMATQNDVQRGFDNQNLQAQTRDILTAVTSGTAQTIAASTQNAANAISAIKDGNASVIREFGNVETALAALSGQSAQCCCDIKQMILGTSANTDAKIAETKYETAMQMAGMEQRILAKMDANKIDELQQKVNALQLQQATAGMLKFPNSWTYGAGPFPPIFGCPGATGNI